MFVCFNQAALVIVQLFFVSFLVTSSARYERIEKGFVNVFSIQKFKEAEFLLELTALFVSPFECEVRAYREANLNALSVLIII